MRMMMMMKRRMNLSLLLEEMRQLKVGSQLGRMMLMRRRGEWNMLKSAMNLIGFFSLNMKKQLLVKNILPNY